MLKNPKHIEAVDVYLQKRKTREYVGRLSRKDSIFIFTYDNKYIYKERSIPIGPDLPLTAKKFTSKSLFPSFEDRIPSKKNPAYQEYCKMVGIDPSENDLLTLVATLGRKGPSSFIFVPASKDDLDREDIINFRKYLRLTIREFGELFDFSPATINRIEINKARGKDVFKRLEIYYYFPEVALKEVKKNRFKINDEKSIYVEKVLNMLLKAK